MENENKNKAVSLSFAALYQDVESNLPSPEETKIRGKEFITWGADNQYPYFLFDLYLNCATLQSIINGIVDYVKGNRILLLGVDNKIVNRKGETVSEVMERAAADYAIYGTAYLQIVRDRLGRPTEVYWVDATKIRTNLTNEAFYYSEDWESKTYGRAIYTVYPKFNPDNTDIPNSILMIKTPQSRGVYGTPLWSGAIKSAVISEKIDTFHLSEISNGFLGSCIVNFNNGRPSDEQKEEIENDINEKFSGEGNAGRMILSFNETVENRTTIERLATDDFDTRYSELASRVREQLFVSFRAQPLLFGLNSDISTGFSTEEFEQSFLLFNRTVVKPIQDKFIDAFNKIYGPASLNIEPFSLRNNTTIQ